MAETSTYDVVPYESYPYPYSHPDRLATISRLFGLNSPAIETCRVLELGCAGGGNLIPMAAAMPGARFLGIDLSQRQIGEGRDLISQLKLDNIELRHLKIEELPHALGEFDYIICHGVYSWVTPEVQAAILAACNRHLAPTGVAYVSYNTYPGWFLRGMVRQMMGFHARQFADPEIQVEQARALLDFLIDANPGSDPEFQALLIRELKIIRSRTDAYVFHEHLEKENEPLFFYQFNDRATAHGLRFLGEALFDEMMPANVSPRAAETLRNLKVDLIHSEQYLDFLRNRTFRRTLLCRGEVELTRQLGPEQLQELVVISEFQPVSECPDLSGDVEEAFRSPSGAQITLSNPLEKRVLTVLGQVYPAGVSFEQLPAFTESSFGQNYVRSAEGLAQDRDCLASLVFQLYAKGFIELRRGPIGFRCTAGDKPLAHPLARLQAASGNLVTTLRHDTLQLNDWERRLVAKLDGSLDRAELCQFLNDLIAKGELVISEAALDPAEQEQRLKQVLENTLGRLARVGLFAADSS